MNCSEILFLHSLWFYIYKQLLLLLIEIYVYFSIDGKYKDSIVKVVLANQKLGNEQAESEAQFETIDKFR